MNAIAAVSVIRHETDWLGIARQLGPQLAGRAAALDESDSFAAESFAELKASGLIAAGVPTELGGGGASPAELCAVLRELARHCGSTALAFAMHSHLVAAAAWRWRHQKAPVDALLKRVAADRLVLVSSGGADWLAGSGTATRVEGGFRIKARKVFASGAPAGALFMTGAVYDDPEAGPTVLHFGLPLNAPGVEVLPTWQALGMRATGSHDIAIDDAFVPDASVAARRPQGQWHPMFHLISMIALPMVCSVYVGVADAARDGVLRLVARRPVSEHAAYLVGGIENELRAAELALADMVAAAKGTPGFETTNRVMTGRTLAGRAVLKLVDLAMEAGGGAAFYRFAGLERLFRDAQGVRYHPMQEGAQRDYAARMALGLEIRA